jgi:hypothetical protein
VTAPTDLGPWLLQHPVVPLVPLTLTGFGLLVLVAVRILRDGAAAATDGERTGWEASPAELHQLVAEKQPDDGLEITAVLYQIPAEYRGRHSRPGGDQ